MSALRTAALPPPASSAARAGGMLADFTSLLALIWGIPFAMLLVGTPLALLVLLLLWVARMVRGAV